MYSWNKLLREEACNPLIIKPLCGVCGIEGSDTGVGEDGCVTENWWAWVFPAVRKPAKCMKSCFVVSFEHLKLIGALWRIAL